MAKIGKYELVRKLARGGMAEVFLASFEWAHGLEKTVVVKRILPQWAEEPRFIEMFFSEAKLASQLSHPNIAQIIEFGEAGGVHFLVMEYVDGPSVRGLYKAVRARGDRMPFGHCARLIASACEALAHAHELTDPKTGQPLQLVHRDVSPDNILISKTGAVKLADFGIAKAVTQNHHTRAGMVKGKLPYMSPEQVRAEPLDRRADIYSLGLILYELLAGARPYDTASEIELIQAIVRGERVPLASRRPDTPPELDRIISRALERDRELRYSSCRVMHADLEKFLIGLGQPVSAFQIAELVKQYPLPERGADDRPLTPDEAPRSDGRSKRTPGPAPGLSERRTDPQAPAAKVNDPEISGSDARTDEAPAWVEATRERPKAGSRTTSLGGLPRDTAPIPARAAKPWPQIIGVSGGVLFMGAVLFLLLGRGVPAPATADGGFIAAVSRSPEPRSPAAQPPPATSAGEEPDVDAESRLKAAQSALESGAFDAVQVYLEPVRNPDGNRPEKVQELLRQAAEEKENEKKLAQAVREMDAARFDAAEKLLGESQGTLSFGARWQALRARLDRQTKKKPGGARTTSLSQQEKEAERLFEDGKLLLKKRQWKEAQVLFLQCLEVDRNNAECHLALGSTYARLREPEKGALHYREFLRLAPQHERAPDVQKLLQDYEGQRTKQK